MLGFSTDQRTGRPKHEEEVQLKREVCEQREETRIECRVARSFSGFVSDSYRKSMPDILAIGFQEICDLTAANMMFRR